MYSSAPDCAQPPDSMIPNQTAAARFSLDPTQAPADLEQRLLAEAVRLYEDAQGSPLTDPHADAAARAADGDLEQRLIARAGGLKIAAELRQSLHQLYSVFRLTLIVSLVIFLFTGATTAQFTLSSLQDGPVINFFWALGSLLGLNTVLLIVWLAAIFIKPGAIPTGSLGNLVYLLGRRIARWGHKGPLHAPALQAIGSVYARSPIGRWTVSAVSHSLWLAFLSGCLFMLIWILSIKQYTFVWETTILSEPVYVKLTQLIASGPAALGFTVPDEQQIIASHWFGEGEPPAAAREAWSGLLIGSLVAYGLLPRAALLLLCLFARWRACRNYRLDATLPGFARLQPRLLPASESIGVVDPDAGVHPAKKVAPAQPPLPSAAFGPTALLGFEIEPPGSDWPPALAGVEWLDLGFVDSRQDRARALEQLRAAVPPPRLIVLVCAATVTPDRGAGGFINDIRQTSSAPLVIVLTDGQRLREREAPLEVEQRFADWRRLAADAGIPAEQVIDADLEHLTDASRTRLAALLGGEPAAAAPANRLDQAFDLILERAKQWSGAPQAEEQAELHRAVAALYDHDQSRWRAWLKIPTLPADGQMLQQVKTGASHMLELLPARLRANPRWYAAGATAGALSCIAAATLVTPAAIASLPLWAGMGAALSALLKPNDAKEPPPTTPVDLGDAIDSAALFAIVLELQGRPEAEITRIIDRTAGGDDPPVIQNLDAARHWLDELRQRFAAACQAEQTP